MERSHISRRRTHLSPHHLTHHLHPLVPIGTRSCHQDCTRSYIAHVEGEITRKTADGYPKKATFFRSSLFIVADTVRAQGRKRSLLRFAPAAVTVSKIVLKIAVRADGRAR